MSKDDSEFSPSSLWNQLSGVLLDRLDGTDRTIPRDADRDTPNDTSDLYRGIIGALVAWMVLALVILLAFGMWSLTTYYIMVFNGLLCIRIVFAPSTSNPEWWRRLNWVVYVGFAVLLYILVTQFMRFAA